MHGRMNYVVAIASGGGRVVPIGQPSENRVEIEARVEFLNNTTVMGGGGKYFLAQEAS